ncbi:MAG: N-acetylmuramidase domain-containing protein [Anaerolineae bacterium]|nr:N-acetylmuramidase domain-containing protein [Anaerolineae bacterium]
MAATKAEVTTNGLRVRSGPGTNFGIIDSLNKGAQLDVVEIQGDWIKVRYKNADAYVSAQFVTIKSLQTVSGFLIEQPDLLEVSLIPQFIIPTDGLAGAELAVANTWNAYGNFMTRLADLLNVPVGSLVAVLVAESSGRAFAADGRMIIRFENHLFWRYWGEKNPEIFNRHFKFDTSSPKNNWKLHQFRPSLQDTWENFHGTQAKEWNVLAFARALDDRAALFSISMGAPQVMGFNYKLVGYESVQHMFDAFTRSAHAQILAMFDFVKGPSTDSRAIRALQSKDYLTFASIYNGPANAPTYEGIIKARADMFDRLIVKAAPVQPPPTDQRGPVEAPTPTTPAPIPTTPAPTPTTPTPTAPTPSIPVSAPPPIIEVTSPAANVGEVLISTTEGLKVRKEPVLDRSDKNVIEKLRKNEPVTLLEPLDDFLAKMMKGEKGGEFARIRTDEGREGFVAAWLLAPGEAIVKATTDKYIDSIPDQYPIPSAYDALWAMQDHLGLPDPFTSLPVQIRSQHKLVNMQVNGFGPNTFAARNWRNWYSRIGGMHNGHDFIVETGTPLLAVADGVIIRKWVFMGNPNEKTVVLWPFLPERFNDSKGRRMMSNILVAYGHMSNNALKKELDVVKAGEVIGVSGTPAGSTTNDHLHLEVHWLSGDTGFLNVRKLGARQLLTQFKRPQPFSNQVPWNTLLFYERRLIKYQLHQSKTIGYNGRPSYPTQAMLKDLGITHLPALDDFTVAFFEYGIPVLWEKRSKPWPEGIVTMDVLSERLKKFNKYEPYPADFLK